MHVSSIQFSISRYFMKPSILAKSQGRCATSSGRLKSSVDCESSSLDCCLAERQLIFPFLLVVLMTVSFNCSALFLLNIECGETTALRLFSTFLMALGKSASSGADLQIPLYWTTEQLFEHSQQSGQNI